MNTKDTVMRILANKAGKKPEEIDEEDVIHSELGLTPEATREVCQEIADEFDIEISEKVVEQDFIEVGDIIRFVEETGV